MGECEEVEGYMGGEGQEGGGGGGGGREREEEQAHYSQRGPQGSVCPCEHEALRQIQCQSVPPSQ